MTNDSSPKVSRSGSLNKPRVAIIGAGISGMSCGHLLADTHEVHLFEAGDYLGGHTATKRVSQPEGEFWIDTGFIVFNDRTYPNFIRLLNQLGVEYQKTDMGFSVSHPARNYEYSGTSLKGLFAQTKNLVSPAHWWMLKEILRFNRHCTGLHLSQAIPEQTLGAFLTSHNYGEYFRRYYILPMVSAIWSSGMDLAAEMPLAFFIRFFYNHGLLTVTNQPQWYTIKGGSKTYIGPLVEKFRDSIYLECPIASVKRTQMGVVISSDVFGEQLFDEVIFACHSDQALRLLADASPRETQILGAIKYLDNQVVLHTDESLLPRSKAAWASWNYQVAEAGGRQGNARLTYNMNILQNLHTQQTFCVSVNPGTAIASEKILGVYNYSHPLFTQASVEAQAAWSQISGQRHTHFCGAYWRNGFHEDGLVSAIAVAKCLGVEW